jgi:hypothetical protein
MTDRLKAYFRRRTVSLDMVRASMWNDETALSAPGSMTEKYLATILDQYKLYVEMTDRISSRRATTNTFFLLVNSSIFAALGSLGDDLSSARWSVITLICAMLVVECGAWYMILRSYRQLSSAKFRVIGAFEERLPATPWFHAEWTAMGSGRDKSFYWPVTQLEQWVPCIFALGYVGILVITIFD